MHLRWVVSWSVSNSYCKKYFCSLCWMLSMETVNILWHSGCIKLISNFKNVPLKHFKLHAIWTQILSRLIQYRYKSRAELLKLKLDSSAQFPLLLQFNTDTGFLASLLVSCNLFPLVDSLPINIQEGFIYQPKVGLLCSWFRLAVIFYSVYIP